MTHSGHRHGGWCGSPRRVGRIPTLAGHLPCPVATGAVGMVTSLVYKPHPMHLASCPLLISWPPDSSHFASSRVFWSV